MEKDGRGGMVSFSPNGRPGHAYIRYSIGRTLRIFTLIRYDSGPTLDPGGDVKSFWPSYGTGENTKTKTQPNIIYIYIEKNAARLCVVTSQNNT